MYFFNFLIYKYEIFFFLTLSLFYCHILETIFQISILINNAPKERF